MKAREKNKERKEKSFPVNLEKRIKELPCGLTIEEAMNMVPGYKREFSKNIKVVKKGEKVNFMEIPEKSKFTSMKSKAEIEDVEIDAIIDTGAAISAMTRSLMEELGYKIDKSSDVIIVTADGTKSRSLGKIIDMELTLNGINTIVTVQVIESKDRTLILGNDWLKKVKAQIDMDKGKINIKGKEGYVNIPVEFFVKRDEIDESYEEEYEDEELKEVRF
jgi:predicted aspartyl protease